LGGGRRRVENANAASFGERTQLRIVADEGVQPLQISSFCSIAVRSQPFHSSGSRPPPGDPDQYSGRALPLRETTLEVADDGNLAPNPSTSCAVFPACLRSSTATMRSGK